MGARRAERPARPATPWSTVAGLALGLTLAVAAWGYLVWLAIDFGNSARVGNSSAWWLLVLASLGVVACLFVGLILLARLARTLGLGASDPAAPPRVQGGRRRAR